MCRSIGTWLEYPSTALTIELVYQPVLSQAPNGDLDGAMLGGILREAADRWEDILEDTHTMTVDYRYRNPIAASATAFVATQSADGTRTLTGSIQFNNVPQGSQWFYDPTPGADGEYNFFQTLAATSPRPAWLTPTT